MPTNDKMVCELCHGTGEHTYYPFWSVWFDGDYKRRCKICGGKGRVNKDWKKQWGVCPTCNGNSRNYGKLFACNTCHGKCIVSKDILKYICPKCKGHGEVTSGGHTYYSCSSGYRSAPTYTSKCVYCNGTGRIEKFKEVKVACNKCNGTGKFGKKTVRISATQHKDAYDKVVDDECPDCKGTGKVVNKVPI